MCYDAHEPQVDALTCTFLVLTSLLYSTGIAALQRCKHFRFLHLLLSASSGVSLSFLSLYCSLLRRICLQLQHHKLALCLKDVDSPLSHVSNSRQHFVTYCGTRTITSNTTLVTALELGQLPLQQLLACQFGLLKFVGNGAVTLTNRIYIHP